MEIIVSPQASHIDKGGATYHADCGLCALKNVTGNSDFGLEGLLEVCSKIQQPGESEHSLYHAGIGNFSGRAIMEYAATADYTCLTPGLGERGSAEQASAVIEIFCTALKDRVVGLIWRLPSDDPKDIRMVTGFAHRLSRILEKASERSPGSSRTA